MVIMWRGFLHIRRVLVFINKHVLMSVLNFFVFICGTNIINNKMLFLWPFWNINIFNSKCYKNAVLVGVGSTGFDSGKEKISFYYKLLFSGFLSKQYKHSVRDEKTKQIVKSI